jgi:hypothetical protein
MWNLRSVRLETVLVLTQDSSTVCAKRTIGFEIVLDTPEEHLGDVGHVESHLNPFRDYVSVRAR